MSLLGDIVHTVTSLPGDAASAVTGRRGLLGSHGSVMDVLHGHFGAAVKDAGHAVSKITDNHLIQASFGSIAVPASILSAAVQHGPHGALDAVANAARNRVTKAELAALAVIIPPLAPASAGGIAAMEATSRLVDGIRSKNPRPPAATPARSALSR